MITLDGKKPNELGFMVLSGHSHPILPETVENTLSIPGRHGQYHFNSHLNTRTFEIPCGIVQQKTWGDLQQIVRGIASFFVDSYGKPREIKLQFDYEPDKFYYVRYTNSLPIERLVKLGKFTLALTAYDPFSYFLYQSDEIIMDSDIPVLSDIFWNTGSVNHLITHPQTIEFVNSGTLVIRPTFIIEGSASSLTLTMNGKSLSLPSFSNTTYEINGENYMVRKSGVNDLKSMTGDFLELMPGFNQLSVSGTSLNFNLSVIYRFKYL